MKPSPGPTSPSEVVVDTSALGECTEGLDEAEVSRQLEIAVALHDSVHELVACGGMTITIAVTLTTGIVGALLEGATSFEANGMEYVGDGVYEAETGSGGEGTLSVMFTRDGDEGPELIEENLFEVDAYLVGAELTAGLDGSEAWVELSFDEPGPRVGMLGLGANPESPIRLTLSEFESLELDLEGLSVLSEIRVSDRKSDSLVNYFVKSEPQPAAELVKSGVVVYELLEISASNEETGQAAQTEALAWDIGLGGSALTGSASFAIEGGPFDYDLFYGHSADHSDDIVVSCRD